MTRKLIDLPDDVLLWLKIRAERERMSVKAVIEKLIINIVEAERRQRVERLHKYAGAWAGEEAMVTDIITFRKDDAAQARDAEL